MNLLNSAEFYKNVFYLINSDILKITDNTTASLNALWQKWKAFANVFHIIGRFHRQRECAAFVIFSV